MFESRLGGPGIPRWTEAITRNKNTLNMYHDANAKLFFAPDMRQSDPM